MSSLPFSSRREPKVGPKLRAARTAQGFTLDQVAQATGLTRGYLSRVERDDASPSVTTLVALCEVLNVEVGTLFAAPEVALVRPEEAPVINMGGRKVRERLMTPRGQGRLQLIHSDVEPGGGSGSDLYTINCELEVLCVVDGSLLLRFGDHEQRLEKGDVLTFPGNQPHAWRNASEDVPLEVIWVLIPAPWSGSA